MVIYTRTAPWDVVDILILIHYNHNYLSEQNEVSVQRKAAVWQDSDRSVKFFNVFSGLFFIQKCEK